MKKKLSCAQVAMIERLEESAYKKLLDDESTDWERVARAYCRVATFVLLCGKWPAFEQFDKELEKGAEYADNQKASA